MSKRYPSLLTGRWVSGREGGPETLEFLCREPIVMRHVALDLSALEKRGSIRVISKTLSFHDVIVVVVRNLKDTVQSSDPIDVITRHASLPLMPMVYEKGEARIRFVSPDEGEIPQILSALESLGTLNVWARIPVKEIPINESLTLSFGELFSRITDKQARALLQALNLGYFRVPRRTKFEEMSRLAGLPRTTFETHVRKAESKIMNALAPYVAARFSRGPSQAGARQAHRPAKNISSHLTAQNSYRRSTDRLTMETEPTSLEFFQAIKEGKEKKVEKMVERNHSLSNVRDQQGLSPVTVATYYNQPRIAELLISKGAILDIFEASMTGKRDVVRDLISSGRAQANSVSGDGFTPLHLAAFFGHKEVVSFLIEKGAHVNRAAKNITKVMPLHSAAARNQLAIAEILLRNGARINSRQEGGFTPLHEAAFSGNLEMVKLFLNHGADQTLKTSKGKTALQLTKEESPEAGPRRGRVKVAQFLRATAP